MDKSDFKIALNEIPDNGWEVNRREDSLYYIYPDSTEDIDKDTESVCIIVLQKLNRRLSPYIRVSIIKEYRYKVTGYSTKIKNLFEIKLYQPKYHRYKKLFRKKRKEEIRRLRILKKRENMKELPKSLQRSLNIEKLLEE